jgi:hypothetical protein
MNKEPIEFAMTRLAELEKVEAFARNFSLSYWGNKTAVHSLDEAEQLECGFSGCFMGWAIHQQWFAPFGLVLGFATLDPWVNLAPPSKPANYKLQIVPFVDKSSSSEFYGLALHSRHHQTDSAIKAVARLFDIEEQTLGNIIYEEAYPVEHVSMALVRQRLGELLELGEDRFGEVIAERIERWQEEQRENAG